MMIFYAYIFLVPNSLLNFIEVYDNNQNIIVIWVISRIPINIKNCILISYHYFINIIIQYRNISFISIMDVAFTCI